MGNVTKKNDVLKSDLKNEIHLGLKINDSVFPKIKKKIEDLNDNFIDSSFPHSDISISSNLNEFITNYNQIIWKKLFEIINKENLNLFQSKTLFPSYHYNLKDEYLLNALTILSINYDLIYRIFEQNSINQKGVYKIWFFKNGKWRLITIDEFIPCIELNNKLNILSLGKHDFSWFIILEKSYAKFLNSYENFKKGNLVDCLYNLTGCYSKEILMNNFEDKNILFNILLDFKNNLYLMGVLSLNEKDQRIYNLIDIKEIIIDSNNNKVKLIKLKNDWNHTEWKGSWSKTSNKWTEDLKKDLNYLKEEPNVFWICFDDFIQYFEKLYVCEVKNNFVWNYKKLNKNDNFILEFEITDKNNNDPLNFSIESRKPENFNLNSIQLILINYDKLTKNYYIKFNVTSTKDKKPTLFQKVSNLEIGIYYLFILIDTKNNNEKISFNCYTRNELIFSELDINSKEELIKTLCLSKFINKDPELQINVYENDIKRYIGRFLNFYFFIYENKSDYSKLKEEIYFRKSHSQNHNFFHKDFCIEINPKEIKIIKFDCLRISQAEITFLNIFSNSHFEIICNENELKQMIIKNPSEIIQRKINDVNIDVYLNIFAKYNILAFLYINKTNDKIYEEIIELKVINLKPKNFEGLEIDLKLQPQEEKLFILNVMDFKNSFSYVINFINIMY